MDTINKTNLEELQAHLEEKEIEEGLDRHEMCVLFISYLCFDITSAKHLWKRTPACFKEPGEPFMMLGTVYKNLYVEKYEDFFNSLKQAWTAEIAPYVEFLARMIRLQNLLVLSNFQVLPISKFCSMLGLTKEEAETYLEKIKWELKEGNIVPSIIATSELEVEPENEVLLPMFCEIALSVEKGSKKTILTEETPKKNPYQHSRIEG